MSEMSDMFKLEVQLELAKKARVGTSLTYFDVIELLGEINSLYEYIAELEAERLELRKTLGWAYDLDEYKDNPEEREE